MANGVNLKAGRNNKGLRKETVTIAAGASLSDAVDIGTGELVAVIMPAAWDAADITFAAAIDNGATPTFRSVYDAAGAEVTITSPAANYHICLSFVGIKGLNSLKLRSGTTSVAVNQTLSSTLTLLIKDE